MITPIPTKLRRSSTRPIRSRKSKTPIGIWLPHGATSPFKRTRSKGGSSRNKASSGSRGAGLRRRSPRRDADAGRELSESAIPALQSVSQLQNQLKSLIVSRPGDPIWSANLVPSSPVKELPNPGELTADRCRGRTQASGSASSRRSAAAADLDRVYAKNQGLPQADLSCST